MRRIVATATIAGAVAAGVTFGTATAHASPPSPSLACTATYYPLMLTYQRLDPSGKSSDPALVAFRNAVNTVGKTLCRVPHSS